MSILTKDVWALSEDDFPRGDALDNQLGFLLRYAILAPSTKNSQPWAFSIQGNRIHLIADLTRGQALADPEKRELYISLGCALENLLVAAEHFGLGHAVAYFPVRRQGQLAATVTFETGGVPSQARAGATVHAIRARHNDNSVFRSVPVPEHLQARLMACCVEDDLKVLLTDDRHFHRWIDALTIEADRTEFADPSYRRELASWIGQGVFGEPRMLSRLEKVVVSQLDLGETVARRDHAIVESAPLLGVICASGDGHLAHLRTGQLFERIWLTATELGLSIHPMSQTMRHAELRSAVAELIPHPSWTPQHVFRVGFSSRSDERHTPRRPLEDVLV
jgi:nitroreductase